MEPFKYQDREISFSILRGKVINHEKMYSPELYSNADRFEVANNISQDIWLLKEDGTEVSVRVNNQNIPIRVGQFVSILTITNIQNNNKSVRAFILNHNAKEHWHLTQKSELSVEYPRYDCGLFGWLIIIAAFVMVFYTDLGWIALLAAITYYMVVGFRYNSAQRKAMQSGFDAHVNRLVADEFKRCESRVAQTT